MRVLVCGGRDYRNRARVFRTLDTLHRAFGIRLIIEGEAGEEDPRTGQVFCGADKLAREWAMANRIPCKRYPVEAEDWQRYGKRAGNVRNQRMLDEEEPNLVVAFQGGSGTRDMKRRAAEAGITVIQIWENGASLYRLKDQVLH